MTRVCWALTGYVQVILSLYGGMVVYRFCIDVQDYKQIVHVKNQDNERCIIPEAAFAICIWC